MIIQIRLIRRVYPWAVGNLSLINHLKRMVGRWSKTFGSHEEGTVGEAGSSGALAWRGCQIQLFYGRS